MTLAFLLLAFVPVDPPVAIRAVKAPIVVFADVETEYRFRVETTREVRGRVAWRFAIGRATVAAKELELNAGPGRPANVTFKVPAPPVRDGVVLAGRLTVSLIEDGSDKPTATSVTEVSIVPANPFAARREWLKGLRLTLHDPERNTANAFTELGVPFDDQPNEAALADLTGGVMIVGEGVSFKNAPGLAEKLAKLPARGVTVLILAPANGDLVLPNSDTLRDLSFRRDLVHFLDKRLDAVQSVPVVGGWPWVEARSDRGRWAALGYPVVASWADGPTPRYLLACVLEHLTDFPKKGD